MNILGLVFPTSIFHQSHQQHTENNGSMAKCAADYIVHSLKSGANEAPQGDLSSEDPLCNMCIKNTSDYSKGLPGCYSDVNKPDGLASSTTSDEPTKRNTKKKKKKKWKSSKMSFVNDANPENDLDNHGCPSMQDGSKEIPHRIQPVRYDWSNAMVSCQTHTGSDILQDSNIVNDKVDNARNMKLAKKQGKSTKNIPTSAVVTSVTGLENMGDYYFHDASHSETKLSVGQSQHDHSDLKENHIPLQYGEQRGLGISRNSKNRRRERSNMSQDRISSGKDDRVTKGNPEATHTARSMHSIEHGANSLDSVAKEDRRDGSNEDAHASNRFSMATAYPTIVPSQVIKYSEGHSKTWNKTSRTGYCIPSHMQTPKENSHLTWQRTGKNIGDLQNSGAKRSTNKNLYVDGCSAEPTSQVKHNSVTEQGLLQTPQLSYVGRNGLLQGIENMEIADHEMPRTHPNMLVESPQWVLQERPHLEGGHYVSRSREDYGSRDYCRRESWMAKTNMYKPRSRSTVIHRDTSDVPRTKYLRKGDMVRQRNVNGNHHHKSESSETHEFQCVPSFQPCTGEKIPKTQDLAGKTLHDSLAACLSNEPLHENSFRDGATPRMGLQKWIPVGKKYTSVVKTNRDSDLCNTIEVEINQDKDHADVCDVSSAMNIGTDMIRLDVPRDGGIQLNCIEEGKKDHSFSTSKSEVISKRVPAFCSSYNTQPASERIQLARGSPIADFEKVLESASPVIIPAFVPQIWDDNIRSQSVSVPSSKFSSSDVSLCNVWNWYERPGNYGLEVKAEGCQNLEGSETNDVSFSAFFVPFLSAVQLFGHSDCSSVDNSFRDPGLDVCKSEQTDPPNTWPSLKVHTAFIAEPSVSELTSAEQHVRDTNLCASDPSDRSYYLGSASAHHSFGSQVIFEYFEHEPPQHRKPLYTKIKELVKLGTSNPQVMGDPSKLECLNLQDLHPASWYSVAWYPIYRIPDGKFRASFLTYHSLGRLVLRQIESDSKNENSFSVVSPVLGMQSYNAQGEGWFDPNKLAEFSPDDGAPIKSSVILKERLKTLEETAAHFARGPVHKDHPDDSTQRHPDYEFFLSRKR